MPNPLNPTFVPTLRDAVDVDLERYHREQDDREALFERNLEAQQVTHLQAILATATALYNDDNSIHYATEQLINGDYLFDLCGAWLGVDDDNLETLAFVTRRIFLNWFSRWAEDWLEDANGIIYESDEPPRHVGQHIDGLVEYLNRIK